MAELRAEAAIGRAPPRPADRHADLGAAKVRRHLLGIAKGRIEDLRPSRCHVGQGFRSTPGIEVGQQFLDRRLHAVEIGELVRVPLRPPSAPVPLSPATKITSVLSSSPVARTASMTRPIS